MFSILIYYPQQEIFCAEVRICMNLKVGKSNGRMYLSIAHGYRDENGSVRTKTIKSLGYLDVLQKEYPDPIAHFKNGEW